MSAKSATGSAAPSVQKWVIDSDIEYQLRSGALLRRLQNEGLSHGSIELSLRCSNLIAIGRGEQQPFSDLPSLLRVELSGCPKLESIPKMMFSRYPHLVSVVFGEHSNIKNIGTWAFQYCSALTSITLPNKLKIIEYRVFTECTSLERVVCNKKLKTIGFCAFQHCSALTSVTLPDKLEVIGFCAFQHCSALTSVTLPDKLEFIEKLAFGDYTSLECVVCNNKNLEAVDESAF